MTSPFGWISGRAQPRLLASLTVLVVGLSVWLSSVGQDLVTSAAPLGIVSYEFAGDRESAGAIIDSWSDHARAQAMLSLGLDYLYLLAYSAWFALAAALLGARLGAGWRGAGLAVSWAVLGSAPLDAVENHALIQQLAHGPAQIYAQLAWWCAAPKFALVGIAAAFLLLAGCAWLLGRLRAA